MNPRSVAVQGIGFGAMLTALQGFGGSVLVAVKPRAFGGGKMTHEFGRKPVVQKKRKKDDDVLVTFLI